MFRAKFPLTSSSGRRAGAGFRSHPSFRREDSLQPGHLIRTPGAPGSPCPWHPIPEGRPIRHLRLPDSAENAGIPVLRVHRERGSTDPRVRGERRRTCPQVPQRIQDGRERDSELSPRPPAAAGFRIPQRMQAYRPRVPWRTQTYLPSGSSRNPGRERDGGCFHLRSGGSGTADSPRALPRPARKGLSPAFGADPLRIRGIPGGQKEKMKVRYPEHEGEIRSKIELLPAPAKRLKIFVDSRGYAGL